MTAELLSHQLRFALRCVDVNSGRATSGPRPSADGVHFLRNRSGDFLVLDRPDLGSFSLRVDDSSGRYLSRTVQVTLPRIADPAQADQPDSLFQPVLAELYPAPSATPPSGWAIVRVTVVDVSDDSPLPGALVRLVRTEDDHLLGRGVSDWRGRTAGEALIIAPGVPAITFGQGDDNGDDDDDENGNGNGNGAVLVSEIAARVEAVFDSQSPGSDEQPPDPDDLEARLQQLSFNSENVMIAAGKSISVRIAVDIS